MHHLKDKSPRKVPYICRKFDPPYISNLKKKIPDWFRTKNTSLRKSSYFCCLAEEKKVQIYVEIHAKEINVRKSVHVFMDCMKMLMDLNGSA